MLRYSLIIPHFNDSKRLDRLLRSVPVSRDDIEVIVVDDCSPNQAELLWVRAAWPDVHWFSTVKNQGAGVSRNVGLCAAQGDWLVFADSDDEFLPHAFDTFDHVLRADDALVYFLADAVHEVGGSPSVRFERMNELVRAYVTSPDVETLQRLRLQHVNPVAKIYSRAFIQSHGLRFDVVRHADDVAFNVLAAVQARHVRAEATPVYRVYRRAGSLTTDETVQDFVARLEVLGTVNDRLCDLGVRERMHAASYVARAVRYGPVIWLRTLQVIVRHQMVGATLRRLDPREVWRFLRWLQRGRLERQRLEAESVDTAKQDENSLTEGSDK